MKKKLESSRLAKIPENPAEALFDETTTHMPI